MKKLIYIAGAALVMLASASCEKKETVKEAQSSVEKVDMVFTATSGSGALKTTILSDGTTAVWSATDNLKVFTAEDQTGSVCNYKSGAGTNTAEFQGQCAKTGPWTAICPAIEGSTYSAGTITFTMPEAQTYAANTFADGAMPCVAYSETNTFNFKHSFGVLKLSLKLMEGKTGSVQSITVTDNGGKQLWGTFTVNPQTSAAATYSTGGTSSVILDCGTGVALSTSKATDFWIVVPQGAFASGFEVFITSTNGMEASLSTAKANTIKAGEVNKMPVQIIEFTIGRGTAKRTGDIDVKWVQLWENGPKWAEYNVGATAVGECGGYYFWGTIIDKGSDHNKYYRGKEDIQYGAYDTAKNLWGSNWQMPTKADFQALENNTDMVKIAPDVSGYDVLGYLYTGRGDYSGNSVFFPIAGDWGERYAFEYVGSAFLYWTSSGESGATNAYYGSPARGQRFSVPHYCGLPVRAILHE